MQKGHRTAYADRRVTLYLPGEIVTRLERDAAVEMVSLAAVARRAIIAYYKAHTILPSPTAPFGTREEVPA